MPRRNRHRLWAVPLSEVRCASLTLVRHGRGAALIEAPIGRRRRWFPLPTTRLMSVHRLWPLDRARWCLVAGNKAASADDGPSRWGTPPAVGG